MFGACGLKNLENLDYLTPGFLVSEAVSQRNTKPFAFEHGLLSTPPWREEKKA